MPVVHQPLWKQKDHDLKCDFAVGIELSGMWP